MASRVEEQITAIEQYLDECKYIQFSSTMVKVDKEKLMDMLADLRGNMPEEMARYRKVINERDRILSEARQKAQELVDKTTAQTNELVGNQEIMQQAYAQANEIVALSSQRAQQIEDEAVNDANSYRMAAVQYMDQMLARMEQESQNASLKLQQTYTQMMQQMQDAYQVSSEQMQQSFGQMTAQLQQSFGQMSMQMKNSCGNYQEALDGYISTLTSNRAELKSTETQQTQAAGADTADVQNDGTPAPGKTTADIQMPESQVPESYQGAADPRSGNESRS